MSYIKRKFLVSRRYGVSLWGQAKDPVVERKYPPGQHGIMGYVKKSEFAKQLEAKQKLKFHYNMREKQFRKLYRDVVSKKGDRVENLVSSLEKRLDALLYRSKLAPSIFSARQMVGHAHVLLNGKKVNIPSLIVPIGSVVQLKSKMLDNELVVNSVASEERKVPEYLECDTEKKSFKLLHTPALADIPYPFVVDVDFINHIIAFYSH